MSRKLRCTRGTRRTKPRPGVFRAKAQRESAACIPGARASRRHKIQATDFGRQICCTGVSRYNATQRATMGRLSQGGRVSGGLVRPIGLVSSSRTSTRFQNIPEWRYFLDIRNRPMVAGTRGGARPDNLYQPAFEFSGTVAPNRAWNFKQFARGMRPESSYKA